MDNRSAKRIVEDLNRILAERDILDLNLTVDEVVEKRFEPPTPEIRMKLVAKVKEFRRNGKVDWNSKIT